MVNCDIRSMRQERSFSDAVEQLRLVDKARAYGVSHVWLRRSDSEDLPYVLECRLSLERLSYESTI